jgi:hypothetical protein
MIMSMFVTLCYLIHVADERRNFYYLPDIYKGDKSEGWFGKEKTLK